MKSGFSIIPAIALILGFQMSPQLTYADHESISDLMACRHQCSTQCVDMARDSLNLAKEILQNCDEGSSDGSAIVQACNKAFVITSEKQQCMKDAKSADTVNACVSKFIITSEKMQCLKNGKSGEIVNACVDKFIITSEKMQCIATARTTDIVNVCKDNFIITGEIFECISRARSAAKVKTCKSTFVITKEIMECIGSI